MTWVDYNYIYNHSKKASETVSETLGKTLKNNNHFFSYTMDGPIHKKFTIKYFGLDIKTMGYKPKLIEIRS